MFEPEGSEDQGISPEQLVEMAEMLIRVFSRNEINQITKKSALFAETIFYKAKKDGITISELRFALCMLLEQVMPVAFRPQIVDMGIVALGSIITFDLTDNTEPKDEKSTKGETIQ